MHIYALQEALFIGYKQSLGNTRSIAFSQRTSSTHLIEDEIFSDNDIINNLIGYEDGHEEPDSLRADKINAGIQLSNKAEKHFLKIDTNSERSLKFQIELRSCVSGYRDVHKQLTNQPSSQKFISLWDQKMNQLKLYLQVTKEVVTSVPEVHDMMDTMGKEAWILDVEPIFSSSLNLIIVGKSPSLQRFFEWTKNLVFPKREVRALRGILESYPVEFQ
ncbi:uncharacterized protein TNCV_1804221 [Trichonephila clavipes]|nr:uncharacterized protein TNCV_1804221 [Trichonephila clavipes]